MKASDAGENGVSDQKRSLFWSRNGYLPPNFSFRPADCATLYFQGDAHVQRWQCFCSLL